MTDVQAASGSPLDELRKHRAKLLENRYTTLEIPGYGGLLKARYRALSYEEGRTAVLTSQKAPTASEAQEDMILAAEVLAAACEYFLFEDEPLEHEGQRVKYDANLAQCLGFEPSGVQRDIVYGLFGDIEHGGSTLVAHYLTYNEWYADVDAQAAEGLEGKSTA